MIHHVDKRGAVWRIDDPNANIVIRGRIKNGSRTIRRMVINDHQFKVAEGLSKAARDKKQRARGKAASAIFDDFRDELEASLQWQESPWRSFPEGPAYQANLDALPPLVALPILQDAESNTGRLGKMIDAWVSYELRRAGFGINEVWPRPSNPRVWPTDYSKLLDRALKLSLIHI